MIKAPKNITNSQRERSDQLEAKIRKSDKEYRRAKVDKVGRDLMVSLFPVKWYDSLVIVDIGVRGKITTTVLYDDIDDSVYNSFIGV